MATPAPAVESPPLSPALSEVLSLPETGSDLAGLSDISSLSEHDEDDEDEDCARNGIDTVSGELSDAGSRDGGAEEDEDEFTDVTRSMIESTFVEVKKTEDKPGVSDGDISTQGTSGTALGTAEDRRKRGSRDRTSSASVSLPLSSSLRGTPRALSDSRASEITAMDLSYPDPNSDGRSPFGAHGSDSIQSSGSRVPAALDEVADLSIDTEYSFLLDSNMTDAAHEALQESSSKPIQDIQRSESTVTSGSSDKLKDSIFMSRPVIPIDTSAVSPTDKLTKLHETLEQLAAAGQSYTPVYRRAARWHSPGVLACGVLGIVIAVGGIAWQGDNWRMTFPAADTTSSQVQQAHVRRENMVASLSTLVAVTTISLADASSAIPVVTKEVPTATPDGVVPTNTAAAGGSGALRSNGSSAQPQPEESDSPVEIVKPSLPSSVSALSSVANVGLLALSTRVSSALALSPVQLGKEKALSVLPLYSSSSNPVKSRKSKTQKPKQKERRKRQKGKDSANASSARSDSFEKPARPAKNAYALSLLPEVSKSLSLLYSFPDLAHTAESMRTYCQQHSSNLSSLARRGGLAGRLSEKSKGKGKGKSNGSRKESGDDKGRGKVARRRARAVLRKLKREARRKSYAVLRREDGFAMPHGPEQVGPIRHPYSRRKQSSMDDAKASAEMEEHVSAYDEAENVVGLIEPNATSGGRDPDRPTPGSSRYTGSMPSVRENDELEPDAELLRTLQRNTVRAIDSLNFQAMLSWLTTILRTQVLAISSMVHATLEENDLKARLKDGYSSAKAGAKTVTALSKRYEADLGALQAHLVAQTQKEWSLIKTDMDKAVGTLMEASEDVVEALGDVAQERLGKAARSARTIVRRMYRI